MSAMTDPVDALIDPVDALILDEAAALVEGRAELRIVVLDDTSGGLAVAAADRFAADDVRVWCDSVTDEQTVRDAADPRLRFVDALTDGALVDADLVLARLPKSLAALAELAQRIAAESTARVRVVAGGRVKHMTPSMNDVLAESFTEVSASRGRQKSRVLRAAGPKPGTVGWPQRGRLAEVDLAVAAHGAAFAGTRLDPGTRFLLAHLGRMRTPRTGIVDLGCGTGILAASSARRWRVPTLAVDVSAAACHSARATAAAAALSELIMVRRAAGIPADTDLRVDLILCNPPFHVGSAKDSTPALEMFSDAGRALTPGGELWTVFNSHLPYRTELRRRVGPTEVVGQNPRYIVTRSTRRA